MTASCVAITAASLACIASSQPKKVSGASATPSRDNSSYTTIFRTSSTSVWARCSTLTDRAADTHRGDAQDVGYEIRVEGRGRCAAWEVRPSRVADEQPSPPPESNRQPPDY